MKKFKRIVGFILVFTMLVLSNNGVAYAYDTYITQCEAKITDDLNVAMDTAAENEKIPVAIWCEEADLSNVENEAFEQMGITAEYFYGLKDSDMDNKQIMEIVQELIMTKRAIIKSIYDTKNAEYFVGLGSGIDVEYISSYAPVVIANATSENIYDLSKISIVSDIYSNQEDSIQAMSVSLNAIRANILQNQSLFGYTGEGVKVGIFEATDSGLPNNSIIGLDSSKFTVEKTCPTTTDEHADCVAMIIAGQGLNGNAVGIAPDVSLYATYGYDGTFTERIDWLLEQGVNVINLSVTFDSYNTYAAQDAYIDYLSYNSNVLFVTSAGNADLIGVTSPGMSYNAITVGNVNDNNTASVTDDELCPRQIVGGKTYPGSSYNNSVNISTASKPDISAYGTNIYIAEYGDKTGTSYAAPHITGLVALLGEQNPTLLYVPVAMKAILTAGVNRNNHTYVPSDRTVSPNSYFPAASYIQYGAGIADGVCAAYIVMNETFDFAALLSDAVTTTYSIECSEAENVRISLSFLNYVLSYDKDTDRYAYILENLDLEVYDSAGNKIAASTTTYNNLEIVDFTAASSGIYTIKINRASDPGVVVYYGLAWFKE